MTLEELLSQIPPEKEENFKVKCPFHVSAHGSRFGQERTGSFSISKRKEKYFCFGCGVGGSFVKLKSLLEGISYAEAKWSLYKGEIPEYLIYEFFREENEEEEIYPESYLSPYNAIEIPERGIKKEEANYYGIKGKDSQIIIPIRDKFGLRGIQVRNESGYEYQIPCKRGNYLFGEHLPEIKGKVIITEGALDAVKLYGTLNVVAIASLSAYLTKTQKEKICFMDIDEVIIWHDNDTVGKDSLVYNYHMLKKCFFGEIYGVKYTGPEKDACELAGKEIEKMYSNRLWIPLLKG